MTGLSAAFLPAALLATEYEYHPPEFLLSDPAVSVSDMAVSTDWLVALDRPRQEIWVAPASLAVPSAWTPIDLSTLAEDFAQVAVIGETIYLSGSALGSLHRMQLAGGTWSVEPGWSAPAEPAGWDASSRIADLAVGSSGELLALAPDSALILAWDPASVMAWGEAFAAPELAGTSMLESGPGAYFVAGNDAPYVLRLAAGVPAQRIGESLAGFYSINGVRAIAHHRETNQLLVADGIHQSLLLYSASGTFLRTMADSAIVPHPQHAAYGRDGAVYVYDSGRQALIRWQARATDTTPPANIGDAFIAHRTGDVGSEPSGLGHNNESPDIIVRQHPMGLRTADPDDPGGSDPVLAGRENFVYVVLRNRLAENISGGFIGTWWTIGGFPYDFPEEWSNQGLEAAGSYDTPGWSGAFIDTGELGPMEARIHGPIKWTPSLEQAGDCRQEHHLLAMYMNRYDTDETPIGDVIPQVPLDNNIATRSVMIARPDCVSERDRYEYNERDEHAATLTERWTFLGNRCPRYITRRTGETYPDALCLNVFEDGRAPPNVASRRAEQIWRLQVPDLSFHSRDDSDYFSLNLPELDDPAWGLHDINTQSTRIRGALAADYEPEPMPECGSVQRQAFGPTGRDNSIYVNVSTQLVITALPVANAVADDPANISGEHLRFLDVADPEGTGPLQSRVISCPRDVHDLDDVRFAFEYFQVDVSDPVRRPYAHTGGYEFDISYITSIRRGIPDWARDFNDSRGLRPLPCLPRGLGTGINFGSNMNNFSAGFAGGFAGGFSNCLSTPGIMRPGLILPHPMTPGLGACIADGPGCMELSYFDFAANALFRSFTVFAREALLLTVLNEAGEIVAQAASMPYEMADSDQGRWQQGADLRQHTLDFSNFQEGTYFLKVEGRPSQMLLLPLTDNKGPVQDPGKK
ncbi:MAG: hypothetical protein KJO85_07745 [Gammaproteobacteria bacterium]|nr:hypothetical protein [Gammaproteobacteria bacterium]